MKSYSIRQINFFELEFYYQIAYQQKFMYNIDLIVLKPYDLAQEYLKDVPIKILFVKIKTGEIIAEIEIKSQGQIGELFKTLQDLHLSKQSIINILVSIFANWTEDLQDKGITTRVYANASKDFRKALLKNE